MGCGHWGRGQPAPLEQLSRENRGSYRDPLCQGLGIPALRNEPRTCAQEGFWDWKSVALSTLGKAVGVRAARLSPTSSSMEGGNGGPHLTGAPEVSVRGHTPVFVPTRRKFQKLMENSDYFRCPTIAWVQT